MAKFKVGDVVRSDDFIFVGPYKIISVDYWNATYVVESINGDVKPNITSIWYYDVYFYIDEKLTKLEKFKNDMETLINA